MTIPSRKSYNLKKSEESNDNLDSVFYELQKDFQGVIDTLGGTFKSSYLTQRSQWIPILKGTTTEGTFTYTHQRGYVFRQGLIVDVWGDVLFTGSGSAAGNLYVELPYKVTLSDGIPFIGTASSSTVAFGAGHTSISVNAISDTYRGEFWTCGSANAMANLAVQPSGRLIFNVRYIGVRDER